MKKSYTELLNSSGLKCTPQRQFILETIDKKGHIDIDNLYTLISKKCDNISLSTVYKNINLMMDKGVIFEVKFPNTKSVYEIKKDKHVHFHCSSCGSIEDIIINEDSLKSTLNLSLKEIDSKILENIDLCLTGKCEKCVK